MLSLFGSVFLLTDSKVFLPYIIEFPWVPEVVIFLNIFRSLGSFQGSWLFLPMPRVRVRARMRSKGIWRDAILEL